MASESLPGAANVSGTLRNLSRVKLHGQRLTVQKGLPHKAPDSSYGLAFQKPSQHSVLSTCGLISGKHGTDYLPKAGMASLLLACCVHILSLCLYLYESH